MEHIDALGPKDQVRLMQKVLTPDLEFRLMLQETRARARRVAPKVIDRAIEGACRDARKETVAIVRAKRRGREGVATAASGK